MTEDIIWNLPDNANLKSLRKNRNILAPGDVLYIPKKPPNWAPVVAGSTARFTVEVSTVKVKLKLHDESGGPMKNEKYTVHTLAGSTDGTTDGDGFLTVDVGVHERAVQIDLPARGHSATLQVGGLDPPDTPAGLRARLHHLGYLSHARAGHADDTLAGAISAFQEKEALPITGQFDAATSDALTKRYGC